MFVVPCLIRSVSPAGAVTTRLGDPLLDDTRTAVDGHRDRERSDERVTASKGAGSFVMRQI